MTSWPRPCTGPPAACRSARACRSWPGCWFGPTADEVTFSSFDYETSAQISVKAQVADEGQALISGRLLADISRSLPAKPVDISADDVRMELVCGSARFTLQTLPVADYPSLPSMPEATGTVPSESSPRPSPRSS